MTYSDLTICFRSLFQEAPASNSLLNQKTKRATSRTFRALLRKYWSYRSKVELLGMRKLRGMPFVPNVREIAPNELRVIEEVERLGTDIEAHPFGEIDTLHERHIEIIGVVKRERVSPAGGISAQAGNTVTGIGLLAT